MAEREIAIHKRKRTSIKASCTRIRTYVDAVDSVTPSIEAQLEERKSKLTGYWEEYNETQTALETLDENEVNDRANFEEAFYALSGRIRELLQPASIRPRASTPSSSSTRASDQREPLISVRLPKLNLPKFSGRYDEWFPFFDSFQSIIHSNVTITNVQKLQYLKASVTGDASNVISSLEISELNYEVAWNLLKERYDNKRVIVHTHVKAIMELPSIAKENPVELRQIADGTSKHVQALQALKRPTEHWDDLLVHILSSKLDALTLREWQNSLIGTDPPTFRQFNEFITYRCQMLEATRNPVNAVVKDDKKRSQTSAARQNACLATVKSKCKYCNGDHPVYYCKDFLALTIPRRISEVRNRKICSNCLRSPTHALNKCTSSGCRICKAKHNTLLHVTDVATNPQNGNVNDHEERRATSSPTTLITHTTTKVSQDQIMLSTAVVHAVDSIGLTKSCRALLDCGSQANFISKECVKSLGLQPRPQSITISGINETLSKSTQMVTVMFRSRTNTYSVSIECIVSDKITGEIPSCTMRRDTYQLPRNIKLADPQFNISSTIDILLGAEVFWNLLCVGQIKATPYHPTLQKTRLGWILAGRLSGQQTSSKSVQSLQASITNNLLHEQLSRFWQMEEVREATSLTPQENYCEDHFTNNVSQTPQGRYVVKLPIKESVIATIGDSRETAMKRLRSMEKRLARDTNLREQYNQFMAEYLTLGHMKKIDPSVVGDTESFYLPHHCVFKKSTQTKSIRVVFDASAKSTSGVSLNDLLRVGPVIQEDLMSIVMRFRTFTYVLVADIIKMYRQVLIHPSQTHLQRILWRSDPNQEVETYELTTLTYGTSSASYLATRCLKHVAEQYSSRYPQGSIRVKRDFYVDDLLTGADTIQEAERIREEVIQLLKSGGFELSKWAANHPDLVATVNKQEGELINIDDETNSHILGIQWNRTSDTFHFKYNPDATHGAVTKRTILSEISKLFDPLGLLGPIIIVAKLILQEIWRSGIQWDESVPQNVHARWLTLKNQLPELNQLAISRRVKFSNSVSELQIHGFCDASQEAYGACVYLRTRIGPNKYRVELLCSKSRVAPLKAVSLPRLELSAALLLAQLIQKIGASISLSNIRIQLWSDSMITLNWILSPSRNWSTFVANRVGEVQRLTRPENWRHITSALNPADILSRGLQPHDLIISTTWWHGPAFLHDNEEYWPNNGFQRLNQDMPEPRKIHSAVAAVACNTINEVLDKHSDLSKACRILAYCLRVRKPRPKPSSTFVSHEEISSALYVMCRVVQREAFPNEYVALTKGKAINSTSRILSLSPFMDNQGLIRVGGRLRNSNLPFDTNHPVLLPRDHILTKRIVIHEHIKNLHAGTQATMAGVRQRFWPLSLRSATRRIVLECVKCFKVKPVQSEVTMGSLPASRVTVSRPFSHCGVDYAGPMILKEGKRRNARSHKAYIAIFVCFATKAAHIELVSDLTSNTFIAALKRFVSRRGKPIRIYSDNGTTFVGAQSQLREFFDSLTSEQMQHDIKQFLCDQEVSWSYIPPNAPHFGGLWEAAVKSTKYHLNRIVGKAHLTFEEMSTTLCEIEGILNSRPITALSSDPNDLAYLTPGHFLVGTALNSPPHHDLRDISENRLVRWQRVELLRQHFWSRWSGEYLHSLQTRSRWRLNKGAQLKPGQLVIIKQGGLPPLCWLLGRILEVHVGTDGAVRTANIRTAKGVLTRPWSRLAILPIETNEAKD